jgi:putative ABC transport system ATP-binding protein
MTSIVELRDVDKDYPLGTTVVRALRAVDLTIDRGEFTTIAGPSGSGKTTVLNLVGCIDIPTRGEVFIDGQSTSELSDADLTDLRLRTLGFIFQSFNLIDVLDVFHNVEFPLLLQGEMNKPERKERVEEMIERVDLTPQLRQRPNELSGGQRQRVAIARALVTQPKIVLADEPTANLDSKTGRTIIDLMRHINESMDTTFIFSSHDPNIIERAERVIELVDGKISQDSRSDSAEESIEEATA